MNKKALVEFVRVSLLKREATAEDQRHFHFKRVEQAVGYAFDTLLSQIRLDESGMASVEAYYVKTYYNQSVKESNGYRYVGVSDAIVPIGEGRGIWYVHPSGGGKPLSRIKRAGMNMFRNLPVGTAMRETFWRVGNVNNNVQIVLENVSDSPYIDIRKIDYGIVRGFSAYADDEEIRIPDGRMDLVEEMAAKWLAAGYNDLTNDNQ